MRYIIAIIAILFAYVLLSGIIVGVIFKGNVIGGGGLVTSFVMIPVAVFLWKAIIRKKEK
jgi:hypothetical protein